MQPSKRPNDYINNNIKEPNSKRLKVEGLDFLNWDDNKIRTCENSELINNIFTCYQNLSNKVSKETRKFLVKVGNIRECILFDLVYNCLNRESTVFWMSPAQCRLISDLSKLAQVQGLITQSECLEILFKNVESSDIKTVNCALKGLGRLASSQFTSLIKNENFEKILKLAFSPIISDVQASAAKIIGNICEKLAEQPIEEIHSQFSRLIEPFLCKEYREIFNQLDQEVLSNLSKFLTTYFNRSFLTSSLSVSHFDSFSNIIQWQNRLSNQLIEDNVLDLLIKFLKGENIEMKRTALKSLAFLPFKPEYAKKIPNSLIIECLNFVQGEDEVIQQHALGMLAYIAAFRHDSLMERNGFKILVNFIKSKITNMDVLEAAIGTLVNLMAKGYALDFYREGGLSSIINILNSTSKQSLRNQAIRALSYVAEVPHLLEREEGLDLLNQFKSNKILEILIEAALSDNLKATQFASFGLFKIISKKQLSNEIGQYFLEINAIQQLAALANYPDHYTNKNVCWMLIHLLLTTARTDILLTCPREALSIFFNCIQNPGLEEDCITGMGIMLSNYNPELLDLHIKFLDSLNSALNLVLLKKDVDYKYLEKSLKGLLTLCHNGATLIPMIQNPSLCLKLSAIKERLIKLMGRQGEKNETEFKILKITDYLIEKMKLHYLASPPQDVSIFTKACLAPNQFGINEMQILYDYIRSYPNQTDSNTPEQLPLSLLLLPLNNIIQPGTSLDPFSQPIEFTFNGRTLDKNRYPDIKLLTTDGTKIPCHRLILESSSSFFDQLFKFPTKGKDKKEIITREVEEELPQILIQDIEGELLEKVILCCYSKNIMVDSLSELFYLISSFSKFGMDAHLSEGFKFLSSIKLSTIQNLDPEEVKNFLDVCILHYDPTILNNWIILNRDYWVDDREEWIFPILAKF